MTCPTLPIMPPPVGTAVYFKPGVASVNGGTTFSLNGSAPKPVVCVDLSPIHIGDIVATAWLLLFFDGANWQVIAGSSRAPGMLPPLFAITNWYVNGTTGDDAAYDGTAATHTSANHGPFRTIQRAADETLKYNMNGYDQFVHVADYGAGYANFDCKQTNGSGTVWFIGNEANPQNVPVTAATPNTHAIHQLGGFYAFKGFRLSATGSGNSYPALPSAPATRRMPISGSVRARTAITSPPITTRRFSNSPGRSPSKPARPQRGISRPIPIRTSSSISPCRR